PCRSTRLAASAAPAASASARGESAKRHSERYEDCNICSSWMDGWEIARGGRPDAVRAEPRAGHLSMSALVFDVHPARRRSVKTERRSGRGRDLWGAAATHLATLRCQAGHTQAAGAA